MDEQIGVDVKCFSKENYHKIIAALPEALIEKEAHFLEKFKASQVGPMKRLEMIYEITDKLFSNVYKFTPCKKGCSHCCYYNIDISEAEIAYIEKNTGQKRFKRIKSWKEFHGISCPFLQKNQCVIYDYRPFSCRKHITLAKDSYLCVPELSRNISFYRLSFSNIEAAFMLLQEKAGSVKFYDIRQVFNRRRIAT